MAIVGDLEKTLSTADICVSGASLVLIAGIFIAGFFITVWNFRYQQLALSKRFSTFTCLMTLLSAGVAMGLLINRIIASAAYLRTGLNPNRTNVNRLIQQTFGDIILQLLLLIVAIVHCNSMFNRCRKYVTEWKIKMCQFALVASSIMFLIPMAIAKFIVNLMVAIRGGSYGSLGNANTVIDLLYDSFLIVVCLGLFIFSLSFGAIYVHRRTSEKRIWLPWEMIWAFLVFSAARIASTFIDYGFDSQRVGFSDRDRVDRIWSFNLVWLLLALLFLNHFVMLSPSVNHRVVGSFRKANSRAREILDRQGSSFFTSSRKFNATRPVRAPDKVSLVTPSVSTSNEQ